MDESRKQFEEWFENYTGCDHKNKIYANMVEMYWQAWQASRAAIEIECPGKESVRHFLPISRMGSHLVITTQLVNANDGFALLESK